MIKKFSNLYNVVFKRPRYISEKTNEIIENYFPLNKEIKKKRLKNDHLFDFEINNELKEDILYTLDKYDGHLLYDLIEYKIDDSNSNFTSYNLPTNYLLIGNYSFLSLVKPMEKLTEFINEKEIDKVYLVGRDAFCFFPTSNLDKKSLPVEMIGVSRNTYFSQTSDFEEETNLIFSCPTYNERFDWAIESMHEDNDWRNLFDKLLDDLENKNLLFFDSGVYGRQPYFFKSILSYCGENKKGDVFTSLIYTVHRERHRHDLNLDGSYDYQIIESVPKPLDTFNRLNKVSLKNKSINFNRTIPYYLGFDSMYLTHKFGSLDKGKKIFEKKVKEYNKFTLKDEINLEDIESNFLKQTII